MAAAVAASSAASRLRFYGVYGNGLVFAPGGSGRGVVDHSAAVLVCDREGWRSVGSFFREDSGAGRLRYRGHCTGSAEGTHDLAVSVTGDALEGTFTPSGGSEPIEVRFGRCELDGTRHWDVLQTFARIELEQRPADENQLGKTRSFVHIERSRSFVVKQLEEGEFEANLRAVGRGAPLVAPLAIVRVHGEHALVEPLLAPLHDFYAKCRSDAARRREARASFDRLVKRLHDADCGGDFKLANIMEVPGSPGDLRVTDLGPKPWREWWANAVVPEARMNGIEPEKYLDFDWRLETMDV